MKRTLWARVGAVLVVALLASGAGDDKAKKKGAAPPKKEDNVDTKKVDMSAVPANEAAEKRYLKNLGEGFKVVRSMHYSVLTDVNETDAKAFSTAIEQTYRSCMNYTMQLDMKCRQPKKKLITFYFQEHKQYNDYSVKIGTGEMPQSTPGVYFPEPNFSMFYNFQNQDSFKKARVEAEERIKALQGEARRPGLSGADRRRIANEIKAARAQATSSLNQGGDLSQSTVQHEVAHQVLWNIGFHNAKKFITNPRWFAEGTAMMFEVISDGKSSNIGAVNRSRLKNYEQLRDSRQLIPLRDFIASPAPFGPKSIHTAYPQSWALVHYLNRTQRVKLKQYIEMILQRPRDYQTTPDEEIRTFEQVFGELDDAWEKKWHAWMRKVR